MTIAFVLYSLSRWPSLFGGRVSGLRTGVTHPLQVLIANTAAVVATGYGALQIAWAVTGGEFGGNPGDTARLVALAVTVIGTLMPFAALLAVLEHLNASVRPGDLLAVD